MGIWKTWASSGDSEMWGSERRRVSLETRGCRDLEDVGCRWRLWGVEIWKTQAASGDSAAGARIHGGPEILENVLRTTATPKGFRTFHASPCDPT